MSEGHSHWTLRLLEELMKVELVEPSSREARELWAICPGDNKKMDSEYIRNGNSSIFGFVEALTGRHLVSLHKHRTVINWANEINILSMKCTPLLRRLS